MAETKDDYSAGDPILAADKNILSKNANDGGGFRDDINAGENISAFIPVRLDDSGNTWKLINMTTSNIAFSGITLEAGTTGNPIAVQTNGVVRGLSGLDAGKKYYINNSGLLSTTPGSVKIFTGIALSTTELLLQKNEPDDDIIIKIITAGETISGSTLPVPVFQNTADNEFYSCDANDSTKLEFVGFAINNSTDGNDIFVQFAGIVDGLSGLDEGEKYYVQDTVGTIGTTPGSIKILVGRAISETELLIEKQSITFNKKLQGTTSDVTVASTTTETDILSYTVTPGTLNTSNIIEFRLFVSDFGVTATQAVTFRLRYGATTIATIVFTQVAAGGPNQIALYGALYASGATNTQEGVLQAIASNTDFLSGANDANGMDTQVGTAAEDSITSLDLKVTVQFNNSSANDKITVANSYAKLII